MKTTKKIRILEAIRQGQFGGGETHVFELSTHLDKNRFEPVVLSFTDGNMVEELISEGIHTQIINTERGFSFGVWRKVKELMQREQIDVVHAHGTRALSNVFWAARKLRIPIIYTIHGWSFHIDQKFPVRKIREISEKFLTSVTDKNICVSKSNEEDGIKRFNMKRSTVIYNAVNLNKFNPERKFKDIREELSIPGDVTLLGYIVRITGQKDPFTMINAVKQLLDENENVALLVVGDGDLKDDTIHLTNKLGIANKVYFQPFRNDIPDILNAIDIYCLPSLWEGFPIGILEAMAMKKPVVASGVDGTRELIENGERGLLVSHSNSKELASAIKIVKNDVSFALQLSDAGYHYVRSNFSIDALVNQVQGIYETI